MKVQRNTKHTIEGEGSMNHPSACAACKHQRRKCRKDCVLAPYFPSRKARQYHTVHRVFGFSNIVKMLSNLDDQGRREAAESLEWEAMLWNQDPVHGPLGAYKKACHIIKNLLSPQTPIPNCDSNLMTQKGLSVFNNNNSVSVTGNNNWVLAVPNNANGAGPPTLAANNNTLQNPNSGYCESGLLSHSYLDSFGEILGNEVAAHDVLHPPQAFFQRSSPLQPNYLPSLVNVPDQQTQIRVSDQLHRGLQGTQGDFENINSDREGHGRGLPQSGRARQTQQDLAAAIPFDVMQWDQPQ